MRVILYSFSGESIAGVRFIEKLSSICDSYYDLRKINYLVSLMWQLLLGLRTKSNSKHVVYNVSPATFVFLLVLFLLRRTYIIVVADWYFVHPIFERISKYIIKKAQAIIVLNPNVKSLISNSSVFVREGIIEDELANVTVKGKSNRLVHYGGSINQKYGYNELKSVVRNNQDHTFYITGTIDDDISDDFQSFINSHKNVQYLGFVADKRLNEIYREVSCGLSLRCTENSENKFEFPSKIIEYLKVGVRPLSNVHYSTNLPYTLLGKEAKLSEYNSQSDEYYDLSMLSVKEWHRIIHNV